MVKPLKDFRLKDLLNIKGFIVFGPEKESIYYDSMRYDPWAKILIFNDDMDTKEALKSPVANTSNTKEFVKVLISKFDLKESKVRIVEIRKDLDVLLNLNDFDDERIEEIIRFILDNFYRSGNWGFEVP